MFVFVTMPHWCPAGSTLVIIRLIGFPIVRDALLGRSPTSALRFGSAKREPKTQLILSPAGSQTATLPCPFPVRFRNAADRRRVPVSVLDYRPYRDSSAQRLDRLKRRDRKSVG